MPSATPFQVVFDTTDPHSVAAFWAAALHYEVEDHGARIDRMVADGVLPAAATVDVDGRTAFADLEAIADPAASGPRVLFQRVPEPKSVKNRVHLDLAVGADAVDDEVARLTELGASYAWTSDDRGTRAVTLRDPEGNEFCVA
jgi:Glyoxalase-like domain